MTLLWDAGQERVVRETRERMATAFIGARDGALAAQMGGRKVFGASGLPKYALPETGTTRSASGADLRQFAARFAGARAERPEFRN